MYVHACTRTSATSEPPLGLSRRAPAAAATAAAAPAALPLPIGAPVGLFDGLPLPLPAGASLPPGTAFFSSSYGRPG